MGGQVRNEKAQTHMGRAASSQNPHSGVAPSQGGHLPVAAPQAQDTRVSGSQPWQTAASPAATQEKNSCQVFAVAHAFVRVLTQVPRRLWSRCPRGTVGEQTVRSAYLPPTLLHFSLPRLDSSLPFTTQTLKQKIEIQSNWFVYRHSPELLTNTGGWKWSKSLRSLRAWEAT